jgi:hypothetical protein
MDRRRYIPSLDGLEARVVLSTVTPAAALRNAPATAATTRAPQVATTPTAQGAGAWKQVRIDRLGFLLYQTNRDRPVPPALLNALQYNLALLQNNLKRPNAGLIQAFNTQLRATMPRSTIRLEDAMQLNATFGRILTDSGTVPWLVQKFQSDMTELTRINANQSGSALLVANDYALMLQVALGVGVARPTPTPRPPATR